MIAQRCAVGFSEAAQTAYPDAGVGLAGGADVILLPEIPYKLQTVADAVTERVKYGKNFSIVAVVEGAMSVEDEALVRTIQRRIGQAEKLGDRKARKKAKAELKVFEANGVDHTLRLARQLEELTSLESRPTILGHLQRGGTPSAADRLLATRLGSVCADLIDQEHFGVMVAARGDSAEPVPLEQVAGNKKLVPPNHPWVRSAANVGICMGR